MQQVDDNERPECVWVFNKGKVTGETQGTLGRGEEIRGRKKDHWGSITRLTGREKKDISLFLILISSSGHQNTFIDAFLITLDHIDAFLDIYPWEGRN